MVSDYQVVVIGAGLGGVASAALLAKNGFKTLLLEQSDTVGGCCSTFENQGYRFDTGATMVMIREPLEAIFRRLGKEMGDFLKLIPCDPIYAVRAFDGTRFAVPADLDQASEMIASIAPEESNGWKEFARAGRELALRLGEIIGTPANSVSEVLRMQLRSPETFRYLLLSLRSAQGLTLRYLRNPVLQSIVAFQSYFAGAPPELGLGPSCFLVLSEHQGVYYPRGGMISVPASILKAAEEFNLEVALERKVERILLEGGRARGVLLEDGTEIIADIVVSNVNAKVTYLKMIGPENLPRWAVKAISSYQLAMAYPMVYLGLDAEPPLEAHHLISTASMERSNQVWNEYYKLGLIPPGDNWMLSWPTESDPSLAPEGHHILSFAWRGPAPYAPLGENWDRLRESLGDGAIRVLEREVMPDIRKHIEVVEVSTPLDFERRLLCPQGAVYGLFFDLFSAAMFRPHPRSRVVRNLYLAGASTCLGGGVPTALASGIIASDYIIRDYG